MPKMSKMSKSVKRGNYFLAGFLCLLLFVCVLFAVTRVDVQPVEAVEGTEIGLSSINFSFRDLIGETFRQPYFNLSKYLGYGVFLAAGLFCLAALYLFARDGQKRRKGLLNIIAVCAALALLYVLFEKLEINYRPCLMDGEKDPSFPSTHSMLAVGVLLSGVFFLNRYVHKSVTPLLVVCCFALMAGVVLLRVLANVHWLSDIAAGCLLGAALGFFYGGSIAKKE